MSKVRGRAFLGLVAGASLGLSGCFPAAGGGAEVSPPTISANGTGRVTGIPDTVVITLGVESEAAQAADALAANNQRARTIIDLLKGSGIDEKDIKTSQFSISPRYDNEGSLITGYLVSNILTVRTSDATDAGALIDKAAQAAGNDIRVQSVVFEIDDKGSLYEDARKQAVQEARRQAEQLARAAGVELGEVRSIFESVDSPVPFPFPLPRTGPEDLSAEVPFQAGSQELTLRVEVTYQIG
ncbi:MAG: SIMPL domain-containing protein [Actinomycetota bacterium]